MKLVRVLRGQRRVLEYMKKGRTVDFALKMRRKARSAVVGRIVTLQKL
jgi:hypothetical protein